MKKMSEVWLQAYCAALICQYPIESFYDENGGFHPSIDDAANVAVDVFFEKFPEEEDPAQRSEDKEPKHE